MNETQSSRGRPAAWLACIAAAMLAAHLLLVLRVYPLSVFLAGDVPLKGDVSRYFASAFSAAGARGSFGYDPHVMAGYPAGLWNSVGKKGFEVLHAAFPAVPLPALFYLTLAGVGFLAPLFVWLAGRTFCASRKMSLTLLAVCLAYWHVSTQTAYLWNFGNVFFPAAACLLPGLTVCAWNVSAGRRPAWSVFGAAAICAFIFYFHTALLAAAFACLAACAVSRPSALMRWRTWAAAAAGAFVFLLLAAPWLVPLLRTRTDYRPLVYAGYQGTIRHLVMDVFSDRAYERPFDRNFLFQLAVLLGGAGGWLARRDRDRRVLWAMTLAAGFCLAAAYGFSHARALQPTQPYRFLVPATLLLLVPLVRFAEWALAAIGPASRRVKIVLCLLLLAMAPRGAAYLLDLARPRDPCGVDETRRAALEEIGRSAGQGRVLCDDVHLAHMIPYSTGRPVIGGLSAEAFTKHGYAGMDYEGRLFGRHAHEWEPAGLAEALATYGIDQAVFHKREWIRLAQAPGSPFVPAGRIGVYRFFEVVDARPDLVLRGAADVKADFDLIRVSSVTETPLVLKLHHAGWLDASDGVRLEGETVLDDPVPFIRCIVPEGVGEFSISKRGRVP